MDKIKLVFPCREYRDQVNSYVEEFIENNESLYGSGGLKREKSFEEWLESVHNSLKEESVNEGLVPSASYLAVSTENNRLLGMINLRYRLNEALLYMGGHIGYSVRKSERNKGYASLMLSLGLEEYRKLGVEKVLITCDKDNLASAKVIIKNGGVLENEVIQDSKIIQRYWIKLNRASYRE